MTQEALKGHGFTGGGTAILGSAGLQTSVKVAYLYLLRGLQPAPDLTPLSPYGRHG
jgi:hypothetical protein